MKAVEGAEEKEGWRERSGDDRNYMWTKISTLGIMSGDGNLFLLAIIAIIRTDYVYCDYFLEIDVLLFVKITFDWIVKKLSNFGAKS